jgi:intracellular sulfur oxidation DsrE/DsrF family protein
MNHPIDHDEALNAFVDGEAGAEEREEVFAGAAADPALERRLCELRRMKALVRHAYEEVEAPARRPKPVLSARRVAALALFALGVATGWALSTWQRTEPVSLAGAYTIATSPAPARVPGLVIQVADLDPAKWQLAIDQASAVIDPQWNREPLDVVIVAYGPGLGMLRKGSSAGDAVDRAIAHGIRFVACGNTMQNDHVADADLLLSTTRARAGATAEILALERAGYAYVRI